MCTLGVNSACSDLDCILHPAPGPANGLNQQMGDLSSQSLSHCLSYPFFSPPVCSLFLFKMEIALQAEALKVSILMCNLLFYII